MYVHIIGYGSGVEVIIYNDELEYFFYARSFSMFLYFKSFPHCDAFIPSSLQKKKINKKIP